MQMNEQEKLAGKSPVPSNSDLDDAELENVSGGSSFGGPNGTIQSCTG